MMATKHDLQKEVNRLNRKYAKNQPNYLIVHQAYGGYTVNLVGKTDKRSKKFKLRKGAMHGGVSVGNQYHDTATKTLQGLKKAEERGWVRSAFKTYSLRAKRNRYSGRK